MGLIFFKKLKEDLISKKESFFDLRANDIDGNPVSFTSFRGKKAIIVVNVASSCGFTRPAYRDLVQLYNEYRSHFFSL